MAAPEENTIFPSEPYYIPGYGGFVPQLNFRFGDTYGKTTFQLLTDPTVRRSPRPLLAPLHKQKVKEDFSGKTLGVQRYLPERLRYCPYEQPEAAKNFPEPVGWPSPSLPIRGPAEDDLVPMHIGPMLHHYPSQYAPRTQLPQRHPWGIPDRPESEGQEWRLPELTLATGGVGRGRPGQLGKLPVKMQDVSLPKLSETITVEYDNSLPRLEIPRAIQQKVIPGYAGFIPRLLWVGGVGYSQAVKEAMQEFDRQLFVQQNLAGTLGKRFPQNYWPDNRIYTSAGLVPYYMGFVPHHRHITGLTYGNSTRKSYQKEQKRRACAL